MRTIPVPIDTDHVVLCFYWYSWWGCLNYISFFIGAVDDDVAAAVRVAVVVVCANDADADATPLFISAVGLIGVFWSLALLDAAFCPPIRFRVDTKLEPNVLFVILVS